MRAPVIGIGLGGLLAASAGVCLLATQASREPGLLIATEPTVTWHGAAEPGDPLEGSGFATFRLKNTGGTSVHVVSVQSGCGCAKPTVEPDLVKPGRTAEVRVKATAPPVGERSVEIVLHTDSPLTPEIPLKLVLVSRRPPPFLVNAGGDLTFLTKPDDDQPQEVWVAAAEQNGYEGPHPRVESSLPYLSFQLISRAEKPYPGRDAVQVMYSFACRFSEEPPPQLRWRSPGDRPLGRRDCEGSTHPG